MASSYHDMGLLYGSEAAFKRPGAYGEFLAAQGMAKTNYTAQMDQFFEKLAESKRQFDLTLGFKEKELSSRETLTREGYDLNRELQQNDLEYRRWLDEQQIGLEEKKLNQSAQDSQLSKTMFDKLMNTQFGQSTGYGTPYQLPSYGGVPASGPTSYSTEGGSHVPSVPQVKSPTGVGNTGNMTDWRARELVR